MKTLQELPPVVQILIDEPLPSFGSPVEVKGYSRRLLLELRQQAEWTSESFAYFDSLKSPPADQFIITASSGLNPLDGRGILEEGAAQGSQLHHRTGCC
jgi:hypothetical protein